jgi:hypothetical protein
MARDVWQKTITSLQGDALDGAQITVRDQQSNALASIFDAQSGGSARPNPFLTGADGVARFFAEPGFYKVTAFKDGFGTAEFIFNNVGDNRLREDLPDSAANIYAKNNILGTVSQSGGVPTGAIIQRGSNANGEFVRYADGTQVCFKVQAGIPANSLGTGTLSDMYRSDGITWDYPSSFSGFVTMQSSVKTNAAGAAGFVVSNNGDSVGLTRALNIQMFRGTNSSASEVLHTTVIGRWF